MPWCHSFQTTQRQSATVEPAINGSSRSSGSKIFSTPCYFLPPFGSHIKGKLISFSPHMMPCPGGKHYPAPLSLLPDADPHILMTPQLYQKFPPSSGFSLPALLFSSPLFCSLVMAKFFVLLLTYADLGGSYLSPEGEYQVSVYNRARAALGHSPLILFYFEIL